MRDECLRLLCLYALRVSLTRCTLSSVCYRVLPLRLSRLICTFIDVVKREVLNVSSFLLKPNQLDFECKCSINTLHYQNFRRKNVTS
nr:MAG TPA_asm: hypothetical protein [Caudoviricetes sp.]